MGFRTFLRNLPLRATTGAFVLHSGLEKWGGDAETAKAMHGMASNALPQFKDMEPTKFFKLLSAGEIALGAALLAPFVPRFLAGAGLTAFSATLLTVYYRTPGMRKPNSIWPTPQGLGVSKDVFMLGAGAALVLDAVVHPKD
ncbi:putative membrane protein YphA (DoxX/SURF4 family) [Friedmanniella endophytica]|uniref:Putative membrane protein YphA (DoxX/SURF4 family) n=1 Tax=Microlunatus kandeliicorticis TaxID=1759536 RepID=A0A7W3IQS7_9ACTN|nr:DoxX family membrane protein [Microlunatus kandeliicorticis]MBA8793508.1 putative membrane protein YphA (DoxX/SURF4 family) [Microlunatus kandeliicorticis]